MEGTTIAARRIALPVLVALVLPLSACSLTESNHGPKSSGTISVTSDDNACKVSATSAPAGNLVFTVENAGSKVTEFYLYAEDNLRIVGEVENIGPGITRSLVVRAPQGKYHTACKPGMVGGGIRADFTVGKSSASTRIAGVNQADITAATNQYAAYVRDQTRQLVPQTRAFVTAYKRGNDEQARSLYPRARQHFEGIEPVAESFGDLDPKTDSREADLAKGQKWTGWHRIEKDLWPPASYQPLTAKQRRYYADDLMNNIATLDKRVQSLRYTVDQIGNGAKSLLDEVASGKVTGEEEVWSHTDLYDFQANVDGARVGYENLKPLLEVKNPALSSTIGQRFAALQKLLDRYRTGKSGFVFYDTVTPAQRKQLSDAVNALAEPVSKMTGAITL
ncbi:MAG: iron uptake system protein EfeO [Mycobacteriales bacterium]